MNMRSFLTRMTIVILLTACAAGLFAKTESMFEIADKDSTLSRAPIVYDDTVLFNVYAGLDDFSAYERSVVITKRLEELTLGPSLVQDSLHIESVGNRQHILYADKLIIIISEADSLAETVQIFHYS